MIFSVVILAASLITYTIRKKLFLNPGFCGIPGIVPLVLFCVSLAVSGLLRSGNTVRDLFFGIVLALSFLLPYAFIYSALSSGGDRDALSYFVYISAVSSVVIIFEVFALYLKIPNPAKEEILFGWGTWTLAGSAIASRIPILMLGAYRKKGAWIYMSVAVLSVLSLFMIASRGAILTGILVLLLSIFVMMPRNLRGIVLITFSILSAITLIVISSNGMAKDMLKAFFDDNGRLSIWKRGFEYFLSSPLFGVGYFEPRFGTFSALVGIPDMAHNTVVQLLCASGLFGFFTYIVYRVSTVRILLDRLTPERVLLSLSVSALLLGSLLDNFLFYIVPLFHYSSVLSLAAWQNGENQVDK
jgi:O-antigen ligase